ncbi:GntR family transcriptional regulator [Heyndrickxia oleronia]|uniref:GntR family transcriptional regulator n=1 Tax=Heyndrickxia TaxID=2837504 RepID=UPI00090319DF|nr:GntR family transcriptional regulator [Heyndrickxia oleronia]NYV65235.1 GntR family transcriptional regulator [Bacillus sp. Gen3]OJH20192.1 GntR family transcriptional regulator [Bacillus obstructivus]MBU5213010.1 GntR family transcriptional regulator [Heyndrickxia oleronia]MCM3452520.1 GntR family transcriptional regulator [Heyndrickxia oleronia]GIN39856.1 HTH-type transcriptional regulator GmuR [Heyndrickxia oleronia]
MVKYQTISNEMKERIKNGYYPTDQPIPDEYSLSKEFGCSRVTMKKALDILVMEGLLLRKRGHGTFIIQSAMQESKVNVISEINIGLSNLVQDKTVTSKVILFEIQFPSEEVAANLMIDKDAPVYHIIRLRNVNDEPYVIEETYMPSQLIPGINEQVLQSSIYNHINRTLELKIGGAHRKVRAAKSNELDQEYLDCKVDDPILEVEQIAFLQTGVPFEYSFSRHRYDKFVFSSVTVNR